MHLLVTCLNLIFVSWHWLPFLQLLLVFKHFIKCLKFLYYITNCSLVIHLHLIPVFMNCFFGCLEEKADLNTIIHMIILVNYFQDLAIVSSYSFVNHNHFKDFEMVILKNTYFKWFVFIATQSFCEEKCYVFLTFSIDVPFVIFLTKNIHFILLKPSK